MVLINNPSFRKLPFRFNVSPAQEAMSKASKLGAIPIATARTVQRAL